MTRIGPSTNRERKKVEFMKPKDAPKPPPGPTVEEYAAQINSAWHTTVTGIMDTAIVCAEAKAKLKPKDRKALQEKLEFDKATFSKLATIGEKAELRSPSILPLLPSTFTGTYEAAMLSPIELKAAADSGALNPKATAANLRAWRKERNPGAHVFRRRQVWIQMPKEYDLGKWQQLLGELKKLEDDYRFSFIWPQSTGDEATAAEAVAEAEAATPYAEKAKERY
jgi:hypothetical protein